MNAFYIVLIVVAAAVIAAVAADIVLLYRSKVAADRPEYEKCREVYNAYHNAFKLTVAYTILCALLLTTLFPFFWMITSSLKTTKEVMAEKFIVFPETPIWSNYARVFQKFDIVTGLFPSFLILQLIFQFYVVYVVWEGAGRLMKVEESKRLVYTLSVSVFIIVAPMLIRWVFMRLSYLLQ